MRFLIFIFCILFFNLAAQTRFNINVACGVDSMLDIGIYVIELKNGHFLSCGASTHPDINYKSGYLVKTDSLGNVIWKKDYDFSIGGNDIFRGIIELPDSNFLLLGTTSNTSPADDDVFLAKIDTAGNLLWKKQYTYPENDQSRSMKLTADGKVIIVGNSFTTSYNDVLLIKTDLDGNLIWRKKFGNAFDEVYENIDIVKNNTEYVLGGRYGYYDTGNPYYDFSIMRTDTAGNPLWQQQYGTAADETANGGAVTLDSGYVLCGKYNGQGAIIKIDKQGNWQWFKNYNLSSSSIISQVIQLLDSSYVLIASSNDFTNTNTTGFLIRADKNGEMIWKRIYPHPQTTPNIANYFFGFNTTADKGFIMTGQYNHIGQPYQNMWLVKTDSLGCDSMGGCSYVATNNASSSVPDSYRDENRFNVYPNPASTVISIEFTKNSASTTLSVTEQYKIKITDVLGKDVLACSPLGDIWGGLSINVSSLQQGIYFISLYQSSQLLATKKVVKQ